MSKSSGFRITDPVTSRIAMQRMIDSGRLGERQGQVHRLVNLYGNEGITAGELSRAMHAEYPTMAISVAVESPHKRLKELETKGFVRRGEIRTCKDSGNQRIAWYPTEHGVAVLRT